MLLHIDIRDLAVVESLSLSLDAGLTVLTGETGAGKSILLTALGLALGDRADAAFVRPGAERAEISLTFDLSDSPAARDWLEAHELAEGEEGLVRRVIAADGRSRAFVNGRPVTLQSLQEFGQGLVEIHGQHAHVLLTKPQEQRRLLDAAAGAEDQAAEVESLYRRWRTLSEEIRRRTGHAADREARAELLHFQIDELEQAGMAQLDYARLVEEHARQAHVDRILEVGQAELEGLYEDETHSVNARLAHAIHALTELGKLAPEFAGMVQLLREAQVQVKEVALDLRHALERQESDPAALQGLEQRLADVHRLARKHQVRPEALPEHLQTLQAELAALHGGAESAEQLQRELDDITQRYAEASQALSEQRQRTARLLEQRISAIVRELGMPQGQVIIEVRPEAAAKPAPTGLDVVEFMVSANPGMPLRPLARVASGGELSRISLAIQVAATDDKTVPTLVFDEVDTGIGGGTAEVVGQKLRLLGRGCQVFCVTHLAQVAAQGHHHLLVEKILGETATQSQVRALTGAERIPEIARMLGGVRMTENTLAHAEEMLMLAAAGA